MHELFEKQAMIFMYRYSKDLIPVNLRDIFNDKHKVSCRVTRNHDQYYVCPPRLDSTKWSILFIGPISWNQLDDSVRGVESLVNFKSKLKAAHSLSCKITPMWKLCADHLCHWLHSAATAAATATAKVYYYVLFCITLSYLPVMHLHCNSVSRFHNYCVNLVFATGITGQSIWACLQIIFNLI